MGLKMPRKDEIKELKEALILQKRRADTLVLLVKEKEKDIKTLKTDLEDSSSQLVLDEQTIVNLKQQHEKELRKMYDIKDSHCKSLEKQHKAKMQKIIWEIDKEEMISDHEGDEYARGFNCGLEQAKQKIKGMM